ncbi:PEP-CTERM sorting domain-containing protein [Massilia dura]|uniref:PEP-CTERM sorting domain-containing protein n=1 Tax=Pseudoduganella dura TaxID=321982 RepID=A0A6I3XF17_9BURK|nr:PEP-CTERM sorting domain-containing protein [Pseudoduganella dura]MUI12191.1 PEP-CTERM sorting domain-containing protein [Pseudoduganella dura]GGY05865.1 hypothetical protein GCM10007386_40660 [Pseudoduganella dura]
MNITKFFRAAIAATALLVGFAHTAQADIVTWTGDTTAGPTFDRPFADFSDLSPNGPGVRYNTIAFAVDEDGEYAFTLHGLGFDTFLLLYENAFDPNAALTNGVAANDDLLNTRTSGFPAELSAGTQYFAVVTGFEAGEAGQYSLTVSGDGTISAVPEPSAWLMLAFGLTALACRQRCKPQR